ncbi:MAG: universal stress protein, partial [Cohnella sp.]|nr:universal stress protein [Cohnella sp.]
MSIQSMLLAYDGSEMSKRAAAVAAELADRLEAKVEAVHVLEFPRSALSVDVAVPTPPEIEIEFREVGKAILEEGRSLLSSVRESRATLLEGAQGASIVSHAESIGCDLIIIGHRGLSGLERFFLGSISEYVLRHAHC